MHLQYCFFYDKPKTKTYLWKNTASHNHLRSTLLLYSIYCSFVQYQHSAACVGHHDRCLLHQQFVRRRLFGRSQDININKTLETEQVSSNWNSWASGCHDLYLVVIHWGMSASPLGTVGENGFEENTMRNLKKSAWKWTPKISPDPFFNVIIILIGKKDQIKELRIVITSHGTSVVYWQ